MNVFVHHTSQASSVHSYQMTLAMRLLVKIMVHVTFSIFKGITTVLAPIVTMATIVNL